MKKLALINVFLIFLVLPSAFGQKIKYKDIWDLLNTKQYETAEPFLKKYLQENDDNPNAYMYMGIVYHDKASKTDILKDTRKAILNMDSALHFYEKAYKSINEKEIKRNEDYYRSYNRRDLRTGEFGVKLSDIRFDLEKKMEGLRERTDRAKMVKHYFNLSDSLYKKSNALFRQIQEAYPGEKELYLRADSNTLKTLNTLTVRYDSCLKAFDLYKSMISGLGKTGYNQIMDKNPIIHFKKDGASTADFFDNDLEVWDYKSFCEKAKTVIKKEIFPMREHLIAYDIEISKLREKLNTDSVSVRNDLTRLVDKLLSEQLRKYDDDPLPMNIFNLKISELEYRSALLANKPLQDSTNVHLQLKIAREELQYAHALDSLASKLMREDVDEQAKDYAHFITNTYNNTNVLKSFIRAVKEFAEREKEEKTTALLEHQEALEWIVNAPDSVPLSIENDTTPFKPLVVVEEQYTSGLHYVDSLQVSGYFYSITPSRKPDINIIFPIDQPHFKLSALDSARALPYADAAGQMFFVLLYSDIPSKENRYAATLAKIYRSDGLAWSNNYDFGFEPKEISFKSDTGEIIIKADDRISVIDKNGKLIR